MMKRLSTLISLAAIFVLSTVPAIAQEVDVPPGATTDQYGPDGGALIELATNAIDDIISKGGDPNGAAAYKAALKAVKDAGADEETAKTVAAEAVADVSKEPEMKELPDTGGSAIYPLGAGLLVAGAGLLAHRILR
ncbi:hypothetical protein BH24ACT22_BH24ACT22_01770 [soil metagenome]